MSKKNQNYTNRKQNRFQPERMRGNVFVNNSGKQWLPGENGRAAKVERLLRGVKEKKKEIAGNMAGYKDSGVEWIGAIPKGWKVSKVKHNFAKVKTVPGENNEKYDRLSLTLNGVKKRERWENAGLQPKDFKSYQLLRSGELVFKLIDLENISTSRVGLAHDTGLVSPAYIILHSYNTVNPSYAEKYFLTLWNQSIFNALGNCGVRSNLNASDLLNIPFILPPLPEQQRIADFLDTKCGILDRTIDAVSQQIEDLEKYKKALITKTVTKGIYKKGEPERAMKDSGVEWIGEVPEEWSVKRLKYVLDSIRNGASAASYEYEPDSFRYVRITDIDDNGNLKQTGKQYLPKEMAKNFILNKKAVLIANTGSLGKAMLFDPDKEDEVCALNGHLIEAIANPNIISNEYLYFFIKSYNYINWVNRSYVQTTMQMLSAGRHKNLPVTVPPLAEQQQIADYLDEKCKNIDNRVQKRRQQLEWLKKYKKSLIFDYVTGKKRV